jgi:hypothetical protein
MSHIDDVQHFTVFLAVTGLVTHRHRSSQVKTIAAVWEVW